MIEFKLDAKLVKAAMMFQAVNDPRYYLNGFYLDSKCICATNGHVLWWHEFEQPLNIHEPMIIKIIGKIPAKAGELTFTMRDDTSGFIVCRDLSGIAVIAAIYFELVDGRFPDWRKVVPEGEPVSTPVIGFRAKYMHLIEKVANIFNPSFGAVKMTMYGPNKGALLEIEGYFNSKAVVMPTRL